MNATQSPASDPVFTRGHPTRSNSLTGRCSPHTWAGLPDIIPAEARDLDWQELLRNLAGLVEPDIDPQRISIEQGCRLYRCVSIGAQLVRPDATQSWIRAA